MVIWCTIIADITINEWCSGQSSTLFIHQMGNKLEREHFLLPRIITTVLLHFETKCIGFHQQFPTELGSACRTPGYRERGSAAITTRLAHAYWPPDSEEKIERERYQSVNIALASSHIDFFLLKKPNWDTTQPTAILTESAAPTNLFRV